MQLIKQSGQKHKVQLGGRRNYLRSSSRLLAAPLYIMKEESRRIQPKTGNEALDHASTLHRCAIRQTLQAVSADRLVRRAAPCPGFYYLNVLLNSSMRREERHLCRLPLPSMVELKFSPHRPHENPVYTAAHMEATVYEFILNSKERKAPPTNIHCLFKDACLTVSTKNWDSPQIWNYPFKRVLRAGGLVFVARTYSVFSLLKVFSAEHLGWEVHHVITPRTTFTYQCFCIFCTDDPSDKQKD